MDDGIPEIIPQGGELPEPPENLVTDRQMQDALRSIATSWLAKLELARKHKKQFTEDARESMNFFDGGDNYFWREGATTPYSRLAPPSFRMVTNRAFEAVKLLGATIYARVPHRQVTAKKFPAVPPEALGINASVPPQMGPDGQPMIDPQVQQYLQASQEIGGVEQMRDTFAGIIASYLNYTPHQLNLKEHSRKAVDEAILKGMGVWWTELVEMGGEDSPPVGLIGSFFDSVDNLLLDPDADEQEDILWCARRCVHPVAEIAAKYGLDPEELKGHQESYTSEAMQRDERGYKMKKKNGKTNDLIVYYKIWSKTGFGHSLKGAPKEFAKLFDSLGQNCYIVVAEGVEYPLNAPKAIALEEPDETGLPPTLFSRTRWPIPFYADHTGWPFVPLQFHRKPGYVWPISHLKPGMPELKFLNWALSFLATRVMTSSKTLVGVSKAAGDDIKDQILKHEENGFSLIELSETLGRSVNDIVSVFQLPQVTPELWQIVQSVSEMFDKRVGLTEMTYGMTRNQLRSAAEAQVKSEQISVRPDDMAEVLESAMGVLARREALAARWLLETQDVAPVLGPLGSSVWEQMREVTTLGQLAMNYDYQIEAGSARKMNKAGRIESLQIALQTMGPTLQNLLAQGVVGPWNALMRDYLEAIDVDPSGYMVPEPPPPQPPAEQLPPPPEGGNAEPGAGGPPDQPQQMPPELQP